MSPLTELIGGAKAYGWGKVLSGATQAFDSIATYSLANDSSNSVTFSNLNSVASAYTHLQLRTNARVTFTGSSGISGLYFTFNSDSTAANYSYHRISNDGISTPAQYGVGGSLEGLMFATAQGTGALPELNNTPGSAILDIYNFNSSSMNKVIVSFTNAATRNTSAGVHYNQISSKGWFSTSPITSISIYAAQGNLQTNSHIALYGIKG